MSAFIRLLMLFRPYWGWALLGITVSFISLMANIILLTISGWFITTMGLAGVTGAAVNYFTPAAIIRACAILRTGGRYLERVITHEATFRFMAETRSWLYRQMESMALSRSSQYHSGDLLARLRGDIDTLEAFYINLVIPTCVAFMALIAITAGFAFYDPALALAELFLLLAAGLAVPYLVYRHSRRPSQAIIQQKAALKTQMVENIQSYAEMTVYGVAQDRMVTALNLSDEIITAQRRLGFTDALAQGINHFIMHFGMWAALVFALLLYREGSLTPAQIPMLTLLALAAFEAVLPLSASFQSLELSLQAAKRLFALADEPKENTDTVSVPPRGFELEMRHINFAYQRHKVLRDFSLHLIPGKKVLVTGPSGIGKSSLLHVLTGLYEISSGTITLNGQDYQKLTPDDIRGFFSIVPQQPYIFSGTIRTNLLIAKPDATTDELLDACRIACLDVLDGLDVYLGEGGQSLSGGEVRRLAIARALLKDAPCLLLDEPTESLDAVTAEQVKTNLFAYARDKALLVISHEKQTDPRFDQVIALK